MTRHPPPPELRPKLVQCPVVDEDGRQEGGIFVVIIDTTDVFIPQILRMYRPKLFLLIVKKTKDVMCFFDSINFFVHWFLFALKTSLM